MEVSINPELRNIVYDNIRETAVEERTGIHLSDLIYCSRKAWFRKMGMSPPPTDDQCLLFLTGYAFQAYMFSKEEEVVVLVDGINCTPDVMSGIEVKSTRQSLRNFNLEESKGWKKQILGYCKALNTLEYDLVVMFVCGDYKPPFPKLECYHIVTTQEEVDRNWTVMLVRKDVLEESLDLTLIPSPDCEEWEWQYCENIKMCQDTACWRKKLIKERK